MDEDMVNIDIHHVIAKGTGSANCPRRKAVIKENLDAQGMPVGVRQPSCNCSAGECASIGGLGVGQVEATAVIRDEEERCRVSLEFAATASRMGAGPVCVAPVTERKSTSA